MKKIRKKITKQMRRKIMQREEGEIGEEKEKTIQKKLRLLSDITKKINSDTTLEKIFCVNADSCHYLNGLTNQSQLYGIKDIICNTPYGEVFCNEYKTK